MRILQAQQLNPGDVILRNDKKWTVKAVSTSLAGTVLTIVIPNTCHYKQVWVWQQSRVEVVG